MKAEDRAWFEPLVRELARPALRFAFMQVNHFDTAQDIVQEAFARVWASSRTPSEQAGFRRWLYRSITNLARDHYRQRARFASLPVPPVGLEDPMELLDRRSSDAALAAALQALSMRQRQAIYLRFFEDQSFAETARLMGAPQVTVRVIVHRALNRLRRLLATVAVNQVAM